MDRQFRLSGLLTVRFKNHESWLVVSVQLLQGLDDVPSTFRGGVVTIGNFDGVHLGHARLIGFLTDKARQVGGPSVVFTFDPHPVRLLRPNHAPLPLTWTKRKADLVAELGVDGMVVYPTDEHLLSLEADQFFEEVIVSKLGARAVVEGPNFYFGRSRAGNIEVLSQLCDQAGLSLDVVSPVVHGGGIVSSSRIRDAIRDGNVDNARQMLTQPYRIRGMVTHGAARGAKIGFPTANIDAIDTLFPKDGVYAGRTRFHGKWWGAAIHIGINPTFQESTRKVEVHLIDFRGSLYGEPLEIDFLSRLRETRPFDSVEQLKEQLRRDVQSCREILLAEGNVS